MTEFGWTEGHAGPTRRVSSFPPSSDRLIRASVHSARHDPDRLRETGGRPREGTDYARSRRAFLRTTGTGRGDPGSDRIRALSPRQKKQVVTIAFPETITSMDPDPASRNSPRESMYEAVFDRFLQQDRQGKYGGHIIESWQWTDGKMGMAVEVRQGVKFHDGSDLIAEDVASSMNRLKEIRYKATYAKVKEYQVPPGASPPPSARSLTARPRRPRMARVSEREARPTLAFAPRGGPPRGWVGVAEEAGRARTGAGPPSPQRKWR